jgi:hypothetical protein
MTNQKDTTILGVARPQRGLRQRNHEERLDPHGEGRSG